MEPADQTGVPGHQASSRLFFLTNRMNLVALLSSRMLAPRESYQKYYRDLLERCPGWVPLLTMPPTTALVEQVTSERGSGGPVLVELAGTASDGVHTDEPVVFVSAATLSEATAIHFPDPKSLREHRARSYANVHPHEELLRVTPELFGVENHLAIQIKAPPAPSTTNWRHLDRVRGALGAALAASNSGEGLTVTANLLGASDLPEHAAVPRWLDWTGLASHEPRLVVDEDSVESAERLTFQAAYHVLRQLDVSQAWSPSDAISAASTEIDATNPPPEVRAVIAQNLKRVRELIDVEVEFQPFRSTGNALVAAKAFLLCLLRPDLGQLLAWPAEETGADETTRIAAAVLAGSLRGVARESAALRSVVLDDLSAAWAVRAASGVEGPIGSVQLVTDEHGCELLVNGQKLKTATPLGPDPVASYRALNASARRRARIAVSRRMGWPIEVQVHLPPRAHVESSDSRITITSAENVKVETVVSEPEFVARLSSLSGSARWDAVTAMQGRR